MRGTRGAVRAARRAARARAEDAATLPPERLRDVLEEEGHASTGAFARDAEGGPGGKVARERLRHVMFQAAARAGFGELSAFGKSIAAKIYKRFDPDENGGLDYDEFAEMARKLNELPPADAAEYKRNLSEACIHLKTEKKKNPNTQRETTTALGVSERGFLARYERKGNLATDAALLGCGSLDDAIQLSCSATAELDAAAAGRLEKALAAHARTLKTDRVASSFPARALGPDAEAARTAACFERAAFCLRFVKGCFGERAASRVTDLLPADSAPDWLSSPGWLFYAVHASRETLARGHEGLIPTLRKAVEEHYGQPWKDLHGNLGNARDAPTEGALVRDPLGKSLEVSEDSVIFNKMGGVEGVGRVNKDEKVQELTGLSHVNVLRASTKASELQIKGAPPWSNNAEATSPKSPKSPSEPSDALHDPDLYDLAFERLLLPEQFNDDDQTEEDAPAIGEVGGLSKDDPTPEEYEADAAEKRFRKEGAGPLCALGARDRLRELQLEINDCDAALAKKNVASFIKDSMTRRKTAREREKAVLMDASDRRTTLALARCVRVYDAARDILQGPCAAGAGTRGRVEISQHSVLMLHWCTSRERRCKDERRRRSYGRRYAHSDFALRVRRLVGCHPVSLRAPAGTRRAGGAGDV